MLSRKNQNINLHSSSNVSTILANAGRVINTPIVIPIIVVTANHRTSHAPAFNKGIIATRVVA